MKTVIAIYCEGIEAKIAVLTRDKERISVKKLLTVTTGLDELPSSVPPEIPVMDDDDLDNDFSLDKYKEKEEPVVKKDGIEFLSDALGDVKLSNALFVPVISEPVMNYYHHEGELPANRKKALEIISKEIYDLRGIEVSKDSIDYINTSSGSQIAAFVEDEIPCVNFINALASLNKRRFYKIPAIKSAEVSLASYYLSSYQHGDDKFSLLIYAGKLYSKFIFFEGNRIKHIGSTIDLGTNNLHTYDVYFSKILLEMENGNIPRLDNIILSGDGELDELKNSFTEAFPEATYYDFTLDKIHVDKDVIDAEVQLTSFTIPVAAAFEYILDPKENQEIRNNSINILPAYIYENQKFFQFGWHSIAMLPLLFGAAFYFTSLIMGNFSTIGRLDNEIVRLKQVQAQNQELINELSSLDNRVKNFDETVSILDTATVDTEIWSDSFERISSFLELRRTFWITKFECRTGNDVTLSGYTLSRKSLTEFTDYYKNTLLNNLDYEPLRQANAYAYTMTFKIVNKRQEDHGS